MAEYSAYSGRFLIDINCAFMEFLLNSSHTDYIFADESFYDEFRASDSILEKYKNDVYWDVVSCNYKFSNSSLIKFIDLINWSTYLSFHRVDEFILNKIIILEHKYKNVLMDIGVLISLNQRLSNQFISNHLDKLDIDSLKTNKYVDQEFIEKLRLLK